MEPYHYQLAVWISEFQNVWAVIVVVIVVVIADPASIIYRRRSLNTEQFSCWNWTHVTPLI